MFFKTKKNEEDINGGLYASLDELIEQKRYLPYLKQRMNYITADNAGDIRSAFKGRGMEFEEVRTYGFGDDIRDIDWRVTARKGDTYTKVFSEEKDREVYVLLDLSPYMLFGTKKELKSVTASKISALLGWQSMENKDRFGLILFDGENTMVFRPQSNQKNFMAILKAISEKSQSVIKQTKDKLTQIKDISEPLKFLQFNIKSRAMVFIISDFKNTNENVLKSITALTKRCKIYCINVYDYIEEVSPSNGEYMAEYNGEKIIFNTSSDVFKATYFRYFQKKRKEMEDFCKRFKCSYINIRTDKHIYNQLKIL